MYALENSTLNPSKHEIARAVMLSETEIIRALKFSNRALTFSNSAKH